MDNARDATQIFGGYGFMNEYPVAPAVPGLQGAGDRRGHQRGAADADRPPPRDVTPVSPGPATAEGPAVAVRVGEGRRTSPTADVRRRWPARRGSRSSCRAASASSTTIWTPCWEPGGIVVMPVPRTMEQADPGGVSWTKRSALVDPVVVVGVEADLVDVEGLRAVDVGTGWPRVRASNP